jgi:hypothetical protein
MASSQWILSLDADEAVSPALRDELQATLESDGRGHDGFVLQRQNYLCGHPIVHAWGKDALVRLVRKGHGVFQGTVHEKLQVTGSVDELSQPLLHFNSTSLHNYVAKNLAYVALDAERRYRQGERFNAARALTAPVRVFVFRYVWLQGFRDGIMGLILCALLAFFTFLVHGRLWELEQTQERP